MKHKCDGCKYKGEHQEMGFKPFGVCLKETNLLAADKSYKADKCPFKKTNFDRLKAENEKLVNIPPKDPMDFCGVVCNYAEELIEKAKSEAYKEFWNKLKSHSRKMQSSDFSGEFWDYAVLVEDGDNLLKEMG